MDLLKKILSRIDEFPTLPTIYQTLSDVMANPRSTANDVAAVIAEDQSAASKILKAANSSIYGFRGRVSSISQAILYIGFEEVKNLIMAMSVIDMFKRSKPTGNFNPVDLWKHSIGVGVITRYLGMNVKAQNLESYFLAGVLHDIGKLIFYRYLPDEYEQTINYAIENNISAREAEAEILGITHTIAGELLAEKWKLPVSIKDAIRYHTTGKVDGNFNVLVGCVHIANVATSLFHFGQAGEEIVPTPNLDVWKLVDLPDNFFTMSYSSLMRDYDEAVSLLLLG